MIANTRCTTKYKLRVNCMINHGVLPGRKLMCSECDFTSINTWKMREHSTSSRHQIEQVESV